MPAYDSIRVVLFDLGGVFVELSGVQAMINWMDNRVSPEELWRMWLTSPSVRDFETGRTMPNEFAEALITEMKLPVTKEQLLEAFTGWPKGLFAGSFDLLRQVPPRYTKATLCNSNVLHWPRLMQEFALAEAFDRHFASHLIGKIKPDEQAYRHVTDTLGCVAEEVLFLDDNDLNVGAARKLGINAVRVRGVIEARQALTEAGVIAI